MKYVKLGRSGLDISSVGLGCMSYGEPNRGAREWTLPEDQSRPLIRQALDLGINFFDTANAYSAGSSEEIVGRALRDYARREEVVIATKVHRRMHEGPNGQGLSRKAIFQEVEASLRRLGTEYIDLYIIHRLDPLTPIEETLEALNDVVKAGKALYLGASSMHAWQYAKAICTQKSEGWARFVSMQSRYNLINREEEQEMLPLCLDEGVGATPWSPLARGRLTRDWNEESVRTSSDFVGGNHSSPSEESDRAVAEAVKAIAADRGVPRAQIALAWVSQHPAVAAPLVGATKEHHLRDAVESLSIELSEEESRRLEEPYLPHAPGLDLSNAARKRALLPVRGSSQKSRN